MRIDLTSEFDKMIFVVEPGATLADYMIEIELISPIQACASMETAECPAFIQGRGDLYKILGAVGHMFNPERVIVFVPGAPGSELQPSDMAFSISAAGFPRILFRELKPHFEARLKRQQEQQGAKQVKPKEEATPSTVALGGEVPSPLPKHEKKQAATQGEEEATIQFAHLEE